MPLFHKHAAPPEFAAPSGTLPCSRSGCGNQTAIQCAYRDRRALVCKAALCPGHWAMVGGVVYCRRHAGTITALGSTAQGIALPEIDNRGPSLVSWIADDIGPAVEAVLHSHALSTETVKTEPDVTIVFDPQRRRRWERSWALLESTGVTVKVSLQVAEDDDDALVDARVGSAVVARGVPPWVARRRAGVEVSAQADDEQRQLFRRFLLDHVAATVAEQLATDLNRRHAAPR